MDVMNPLSGQEQKDFLIAVAKGDRKQVTTTLERLTKPQQIYVCNHTKCSKTMPIHTKIKYFPYTKGETALHLACMNNDVPMICDIFERCGADHICTSNKGWTPFHYHYTYETTMALCLSLNVSHELLTQRKDQYGYTPVHICCGTHDTAMLKAFYDGGMIKDMRWLDGPCAPISNFGETPLDVFLQEYSIPEFKVHLRIFREYLLLLVDEERKRNICSSLTFLLGWHPRCGRVCLSRDIGIYIVSEFVMSQIYCHKLLVT
jgi:hypothetical protein